MVLEALHKTKCYISVTFIYSTMSISGGLENSVFQNFKFHSKN